MVERLSPLDMSFLYLESATTAMHVGSVQLFDPPPGGVDFDALLRHVGERVTRLPRYRQRIRFVPGRLANPVWVDDAEFDLAYHVRRSALPRPGSIDQLNELVGRIQSRRLDRNRPLWELYLVEGLADGRFAILTKTHHAMADGAAAVNIGTALLDPSPEPLPTPAAAYRPGREPGALELLADAVADLVVRPTRLADALRGQLLDLRAATARAQGLASGAIAALRTATMAAPRSPLNGTIGEQRRFAMAATDLDDYKRVRKAHGGTVNDVILATVTGALRAWFLTRGEPVTGSTVRAMVPLAMRSGGEADGGDRVAAYFVDLPLGEPRPVMRLHQIGYQMAAHVQSGQSVSADALASLSGFAPPRIHSAAARLVSGMTRRLFNLVVVNVPGPQLPLFALGAPMTATYPVIPLAQGQAVTVGVTSYNGGVYFGLNADRDAMPDVDVLALCLEESLAELVESVR